MKAIVFRSARQKDKWAHASISLEEYPDPVPGSDEVLLEVAYCGICGSDFAMAGRKEDGTMQYPGVARFPLVPGHEFSAFVLSAGKSVSKIWRQGLPVIAEETTGCGECPNCNSGQPRFCRDVRKTGFTHDGAFAPLVKIPARKIWSVEPIVEKYGEKKGMQLAALIQPYAIPFSAMFGGANKRWLPGSRVLVIGAGPIGFAAADLAYAAGASETVLVEKEKIRREKLARFPARILENIPGSGEFDWVIDAAGVPELASAVMELLAPHGAYVLLARRGDEISLDTEALAMKNAHFFSVDGHFLPDAYPKLISLLASGRLHGEAMIDRVVAPEEGKEILEKQKKGSGKILISFKGE